LRDEAGQRGVRVSLFCKDLPILLCRQLGPVRNSEQGVTWPALIGDGLLGCGGHR
jgi:hypothetical protein